MHSPELTYYDLGDRVTAFSTTRHGGYSQGNYGELNVNRYCGDDEVAIARNRQLLCEALDLAEDRLLMPHQVHGVQVARIMPSSLTRSLEGIDALITDVPDVCIGVSTADCLPIILYDAEHHAAGVVHSGWRGTVANIIRATVAAMQEAYRSRPGTLQAVIGPGISLDNFEVGDEVYEQFAAASFPMKYVSRKFPAMDGSCTEKWHIDLWGCCFLQLTATGIHPRNIHEAGICTYESCDDYFSARRLGVNSGRILTGIILRQP